MILDNPEDDTLTEKIGCPLYTAPELLCPEPKYRGKPADMWALGVILYTMLVGHYPFFVKGNSNLISIIRQCFVQLPGHLSRSARWLLLALLRKNINDRVPIEHIFLSPWLKEQRPFHMYIPVDVEIPADEPLNTSSSMDCAELDEDVGVQPLDYSCSSLSLNCTYSYAEMGWYIREFIQRKQFKSAYHRKLELAILKLCHLQVLDLFVTIRGRKHPNNVHLIHPYFNISWNQHVVNPPVHLLWECETDLW